MFIKQLRQVKIIIMVICLLAFALVCGCAQTAAKKDSTPRWSCFYLEEGKDSQCRNYYDESYSHVLKDSIASVAFVKEEFTKGYTVEKLINAIKADGYRLAITAPEYSMDWLNAVLRMPNLQNMVIDQKGAMGSTPEIKKFTHLTMKDQFKRFDELSPEGKTNIMRLNRLMLEYLYEKECPKSHYIVAVKTKTVCNDQEKKDYLALRKKEKLPLAGYEDLKYSIFEFDFDCARKNYRIQGQFDYNSKDEKLEGRAFPFLGWMNVDKITEGIYQKVCIQGNHLKKAN